MESSGYDAMHIISYFLNTLATYNYNGMYDYINVHKIIL